MLSYIMDQTHIQTAAMARAIEGAFKDGGPMVEVMRALAARSTGEYQTFYEVAAQEVNEGRSIAGVMRRPEFSSLFAKDFVDAIAEGEQGGSLETRMAAF